MYLGAGTPPGRRPRGSGEGTHKARERPPGTYAGGKRSTEVYNYTKYTVYRVQYTGYKGIYQVYSIQGTVYRVQGYIPSIQYTGYNGIRAKGEQGQKGKG